MLASAGRVVLSDRLVPDWKKCRARLLRARADCDCCASNKHMPVWVVAMQIPEGTTHTLAEVGCCLLLGSCCASQYWHAAGSCPHLHRRNWLSREQNVAFWKLGAKHSSWYLLVHLQVAGSWLHDCRRCQGDTDPREASFQMGVSPKQRK